ncbi:MAG: hypothetical protein J5659_05365 [Clostridia bacterium]|nr:hypothetical protein [Clostridia bacterium]
MEPTSKWGTPYVRLNGLNVRTGASVITDSDFDDYPAFTMAQNQSAPSGIENYIMGVFQADNTFPLNVEIDDWSIAYTAVNNSELSLNNIGVFTGENADLSYITDNTELAPVAFLTGQRYHILVNNISGTPNLNDANQFKEPPYNNSREIWAPNAAANPSISDATTFYRGLNYNGYATQIYSFGIKSLFLEIRVIPTTISGSPLGNTDYSLKDYAALPQADRNNNPIGRAYARVYRRSNTNGTYSYVSGDFSTILPVMARALKSNSYTSYVPYRLLKNDGDTNYLQLPLYGIAHTRTQGFVRWLNTGYGDYFFGADKVSGKRITDLGGGEYNYNLYLDGTEENFEYLRKCCAQYGLFFCDSVDLGLNDHLYDSTYEANNGRWLHDKMHLGIIEDNGYTEGRYTSGIENGLQPQFTWKDTTESNYDPDVPPTPENQYDNTTVFNSIGDSATMFKRYVLNGTNVEQLGRDLFKIVVDSAIDNPKYDDYATVINASFLVSDPLDSIISLQRYPMAIPHGSSAVENIKLGTNTCTAIGYPMSKTAYEYAFQGKKIRPRFGDSFLDYEPYTKFEMYIPFCGTVELSPRDILNRDLSARLVVDYSTGTCTGYILSDNLVIETLNGNIAINIPVAGIDSATIQGNISNAVANSRSAYNNKMTAAFGLAKSMVNPFSWSSGKQVGALGTAINAEYAAETANYSLEHIPAAPHTIGSASPCGAWAIDLKCRLIIYYPTGEVLKQVEGLPAWDPLKLAVYGMSTGFYTAEPAQISSFTSGLLCAQNPILNSMTTNSQTYPASSQELDMIRAAIADGIIL